MVDGVKQTPARAMLRAVGFEDADFGKPQIGIASTWANLTPCNMHIDELAREAAAGADAAGGKSVLFNTITVSDGISMGSPGHALLAGVARGHRRFDRDGGRCRGLRRLRGDRRLRQEHARLRDGALRGSNRPAVFVYGGTIRPGAGRRDIVSVFEAVGGHAGRHDHRDAAAAGGRAHGDPGPGQLRRHVHGQHHGLGDRGAGPELPDSSAQEAVGAQQAGGLPPRRRGGRASWCEAGIRPRDILTRKAFENAITVVIALGGSTNAVLHLLAIAHAARRTPHAG